MVQYINKAALVAWAKETYLCENTSMIRKVCYKQLLKYLDTLEVKEVDLEEEIERVRKTHFINDDFDKATLEGRQITNIAKHFFELGIQTSNPLTWKDVKLIWNITDEMDNMPEEEFYKKVLKRFKARKGE
jgi:hypothetical protein